MLTEADHAIQMEINLITRKELAMVLTGLHHPRGWQESQWLDACSGERGAEDLLDQAVTMLWGWPDWQTT